MMLNSRSLAVLVTLVEILAAACGRQNGHLAIEDDPMNRQRTLLKLPTAPDAVVIGENQVAIIDDHSPCMVPVIQGIGSYSDVGWVAPRFFLESPAGAKPGYEFAPLPAGRVRFTARFRVPVSEDEALRLWGTRELGGEPHLFCEVWATLRSLEGTGIRRLAAWPVQSVMAKMPIDKKQRELMLNLGPDWSSGGPVTASIDLSDAEHDALERDLKDTQGVPVTFKVSSRMRHTGCRQNIDLEGVYPIEAFGLRDGERGAVSMPLLRLAVFKLVSRDTRVEVQGECGSQFVLGPPGPNDALTQFLCERYGNSLRCGFEGQFFDTALVLYTEMTIGDRVAGVR